jgi:hypothetical protein
MTKVVLELSKDEYARIREHLVRSNPKSEEAGFCFVTQSAVDCFKFLEWRPVALDEFAYRSLYHIELTDACRAGVIKRAHDLKACLVEFHSHPLSDTAYFSGSDQSGFAEFVPHVWWRLKGKPYCAVVMGRSTFDSLAWLDRPTDPNGVLRLAVGEEILEPTGKTVMGAGDYVYRKV